MRTKLKEDVAYGIYDRPGPGTDEEPEAFDSPIVPGPQMSTQLSTEKPPIEDEDYVPTTTSALALSASEIASKVPNDQIKFFYKALHRLLDKATDRTAIQIGDAEVRQENLKRKIESVIIEMISPQDEKEFDEYRTGKADAGSGVDYFGEEEPTQDTQSAKRDDKSNLEDLAKEFGFSGPSGARQYVNRILNRMGFMAEIVDDMAIESLMGMAVPEYINSMREGDFIDDEDVQDLRKAPDLVRDLPSYKYFFVSGFVLPAYREFSRKSNNEVRASIEQQGFPKSVHDSLFNQATGLAKQDLSAIDRKIDQSAQKGELERGQVSSLKDAARKLVLSDKSQLPDADQFVELAASKWQALSRSRRQTILKKALQETLDDM